MKKNVYAMYFSPTGGTKKAALMLAEGLAEQVTEVDLSEKNAEFLALGAEDLAVVAAPVFGGRIPGLMAERLRKLKGDQTPVVVTGVYGNRAFEDALLELSDILKEQGFVTIAGTALLAEHSMVREVAAGRPDEEDGREIRGFAEKILEKLENGEKEGKYMEELEAELPGNRPYKEWKKMPTAPVASDACKECGLCAKLCPADAISVEDLKNADVEKCILCLRCISVCPSHARSLPAKAQEALNQKLMPLKGIRRENELFL